MNETNLQQVSRNCLAELSCVGRHAFGFNEIDVFSLTNISVTVIVNGNNIGA
jgi:hypothetical protein